MKDKRTYKYEKEHGEDMSHENEAKIKSEPKEDRSSLDLTFLIEQHKREIWEYKQKESEWLKTDNMFKGSTDSVIKFLSNKSNIFEDINIILKMPKWLFIKSIFS